MNSIADKTTINGHIENCDINEEDDESLRDENELVIEEDVDCGEEMEVDETATDDGEKLNRSSSTGKEKVTENAEKKDCDSSDMMPDSTSMISTETKAIVNKHKDEDGESTEQISTNMETESAVESENEDLTHNIEVLPQEDSDAEDLDLTIKSDQIGVEAIPLEEESALEDTSTLVVDLCDVAYGNGTLRFKCFLCCYKTFSKEKLVSHMIVHSVSFAKTKDLFALHCPLCPYVQDNCDRFKAHLLCHDDKMTIPIFSCVYCSKVSDNLPKISQHLKNTHSNKPYKFIGTELNYSLQNCVWCDSFNSSTYSLREHLSSDHQDKLDCLALEGALSGDNIYESDPLPYQQDSSQLRQLLTSKQTENNRSTAAKVSTERQMPGGRFHCPHCKFNHNAEGEWIQHLKNHITSGTKQYSLYRCKLCHWASTSQKKMVVHNLVIHQQPVGNVVSEKIYIEAQSSLTSKCKYSCTHCMFVTNNAAAIKGHMTAGLHYMDSDSKFESELSVQKTRYVCDTCNFTTNDESAMKGHITIHRNAQDSSLQSLDLAESEKSPCSSPAFKCGYCDYEAGYRFSVSRHSRKHHRGLPVNIILVSLNNIYFLIGVGLFHLCFY